MTRTAPLSPRNEALAAILGIRETYSDASISSDTWEKIVALAWDSRTRSGDRRETQRELRQVLLEASRVFDGRSSADS